MKGLFERFCLRLIGVALYRCLVICPQGVRFHRLRCLLVEALAHQADLVALKSAQ